eukprot:4469671-Lingulodinium_polyedra.AAC.1
MTSPTRAGLVCVRLELHCAEVHWTVKRLLGLAHNVHNAIPNIENCSACIGCCLSSHPECVLV